MFSFFETDLAAITYFEWGVWIWFSFKILNSCCKPGKKGTANVHLDFFSKAPFSMWEIVCGTRMARANAKYFL